MEVAGWFLAPLAEFTDFSNRMAYIYLASSVVIATAIYLVNRLRQGTAENVSLLRWLLPREVFLHPSAQTDYAYFLINKLLLASIYVSIVFTSKMGYVAVSSVIEGAFGPSQAQVAPHWGWSVLTTLVIVLVLDFTLWYMHYLFHKVPLLWTFHKVHHSAEVMTPITAERTHPVEEGMTSIAVGVVVGGTYAILEYLLGDAAIHIRLFDLNIVLAVFYFAAFHLRHSHIWLRYPYWLQHVLVCPAQHHIHHSVEERHWDKNMGFIFAFWDWAFGTLYAPREKEEITFGLGTHEDGGDWHSVGALYLLPFRQIRDRYLGARGRDQSDGFKEPAE